MPQVEKMHNHIAYAISVKLMTCPSLDRNFKYSALAHAENTHTHRHRHRQRHRHTEYKKQNACNMLSVYLFLYQPMHFGPL